MTCQIKFCGLTREEDMHALSALQVDFVGFNFAKGPRKISAETAARLSRLTPVDCKRVGLFVDNERDYMNRCLASGQCEYVQLHGQENEAEIRYWQQTHKVIKAFRVRDAETLAAAQACPADIVLLDAYVPGESGGTGAAWDYTLLQAWPKEKPFMLAGGLQPENVADAIAACHPAAVDCASGIESAPAIKDASKMHAFVAAVRGDLV